MSKEEEKVNIDDLQKKIEELEKQKSEYLSGWQRERADFLNYKKEEMERIKGFMVYAGMELVLRILPILDNFEIATHQNFPSENLSGQEKERLNKVIDGFLQIKNQLWDFLKSQGVEEIKSVGEKFDPRLHEVVEEVGVENPEVEPREAKESGIIVEEVRKGYKINGELLRPAKVRVAK